MPATKSFSTGSGPETMAETSDAAPAADATRSTGTGGSHASPALSSSWRSRSGSVAFWGWQPDCRSSLPWSHYCCWTSGSWCSLEIRSCAIDATRRMGRHGSPRITVAGTGPRRRVSESAATILALGPEVLDHDQARVPGQGRWRGRRQARSLGAQAPDGRAHRLRLTRAGA